MTDWTAIDDAWLSGFADGEGCFGMRGGTPSLRGGGFTPIFSIQLRVDDVAILETLKVAFGGSLHYWTPKTDPGDNSRPSCRWSVASKQDLKRLVGYFDRFPLRAKKANEYAVWRLAARAYIREGCHAPELPALAAALKEKRVYVAPPIPERSQRSRVGCSLAQLQGAAIK